jgi:hypothetical protein
MIMLGVKFSFKRNVFAAPIFLAALFAALFSMSFATHAQTISTAAIESGVDSSIAPGDDFFAYANGAWLKATAMPVGKARWTARDEIAALTAQQVLNLMSDGATAPVNSMKPKAVHRLNPC